MSRSPTTPRSPVPPSSFPSGLQPNASRNERNGNRTETNTRRTSRTNMNFEQALQAGGTVVIKEGIDFDTLGEDLTPSPKFLSNTPLSPLSPPTSTPRPQSLIQQVATTNNMPSPTPTQFKSSLASPTSRPVAPASASTSASSSSNDLFYDAEDPDYQTKRRSMYRSQGTASSPDLATLVRKAKQRATILPSQLIGKDKRPEAAPPLPAGSHAPSDPSSPRPRHRHRSSTSSGHTVPATITQPNMSKGKLQKSRTAGPSSGADGVSTNAGYDDGSVKASVGGVFPALEGADSNLEPKIFRSAKDECVFGQDARSEYDP